VSVNIHAPAQTFTGQILPPQMPWQCKHFLITPGRDAKYSSMSIDLNGAIALPIRTTTHSKGKPRH
jgi:hypothetical protein